MNNITTIADQELLVLCPIKAEWDQSDQSLDEKKTTRPYHLPGDEIELQNMYVIYIYIYIVYIHSMYIYIYIYIVYIYIVYIYI